MHNSQMTSSCNERLANKKLQQHVIRWLRDWCRDLVIIFTSITHTHTCAQSARIIRRQDLIEPTHTHTHTYIQSHTPTHTRERIRINKSNCVAIGQFERIHSICGRARRHTPRFRVFVLCVLFCKSQASAVRTKKKSMANIDQADADATQVVCLL